MFKMVRPIEAEELAFPVQCVTNPHGWNGIVVYDDISYPIHLVRPIEAEELAFPVQCVTNPHGWNGIVVYDDISYPIHLSESHMPRGWAVDNLIATRAGGGDIFNTESQTRMVIKLTSLLLLLMIQIS